MFIAELGLESACFKYEGSFFRITTLIVYSVYVVWIAIVGILFKVCYSFKVVPVRFILLLNFLFFIRNPSLIEGFNGSLFYVLPITFLSHFTQNNIALACDGVELGFSQRLSLIASVARVTGLDGQVCFP